MARPPESTHDRLNRELARMQLRDAGLWGGWAVLIITLVGFVMISLNTITGVRYVTGTAGGTMPLMTETGASITTRVTVEGQTRDIKLPSRLVHPARGEVICLRAGRHRFTGHTSYTIVSPTLCDDAQATPQVE